MCVRVDFQTAKNETMHNTLGKKKKKKKSYEIKKAINLDWVKLEWFFV